MGTTNKTSILDTTQTPLHPRPPHVYQTVTLLTWSDVAGVLKAFINREEIAGFRETRWIQTGRVIGDATVNRC